MMRPRLNPLIASLSAPPIPAVQAWGRAYDGRLGPLVDLSQAVPGYPPEPRMLNWLAEAAGSVAACGYGPIEGEGDRTLEWWLQAHRAFFERQANREGFVFRDDMDTVFERFTVIWPPEVADR